MKGTQGNDWTGNGKSIYMTLGASNHTDKDREARDFYATDPIAIDRLVSCPSVVLPKKIWECACGKGHLSKRLEELGYDVFSTDIEDRGCGFVLDFLKAERCMPADCSCILTNPPYKYATEFVLHALELLPDNGLCVMFLKTTFLEGTRRYKELYSKCPPEYVLQFSKRVLCAKNADFEGMLKGGGSAVAYCWMVWRKGFRGETTIKWI